MTDQDPQNMSAADAWESTPVDLRGKTIAVIGATGGVGTDITHELAASGATVIATGRDSIRLNDFVAGTATVGHVGRVIGEVLDALDPELASAVASIIRRRGRLDAVVFAVGDWGKPGQGKKPLVEHSDEEWEDLVRGNLTSLFRLIREFVPVMDQDGTIVQVNGLSADVPYPTNGVFGATSAGTKSLMRTTAVELGGSGPRIYELILGVVRTRANPDNTLPGYSWLTGAQAGQHVASLVAGDSALRDSVVQYFIDHQQGPVAGPIAL